MKTKSTSQSGFLTLRRLVAFALCAAGSLLGMLSFAASPLVGTAGTDAKPTGSSLIGNQAMQGLGAPGSISLAADSAALTIPSIGFTLPAAGDAARLKREWRIVESPNVIDAAFNVLPSVTCSGKIDCWAVGYTIGSAAQTLTEHWDGSSWAIVASPNVPDSSYLDRVTCVSTSDCWAVGTHLFLYQVGYSPSQQTLIEHWDGSSWAIIGSANTDVAQNNILNNVTCPSASDCWAAGVASSGVDGSNQTLTEHWDGSSWAIISSANTDPAQNNVLYDVTCGTRFDCWGAGYASSGLDGTLQTLTEHWDGSSWALVASANTDPAQSNFLTGVTCVRASDCWAVGSASSGTDGTYQSLTEHWDGRRWAIHPSANNDPGLLNYLGGVTCVTGRNCWAVGYKSADDGSGIPQTLIEHFKSRAQ